MQAAGRRAFQEVGRCDGKRHLMGLQNRVSGAKAWRKIGGRGSRGHEDGAGMEWGGRRWVGTLRGQLKRLAGEYVVCAEGQRCHQSFWPEHWKGWIP